eukprot:gene8942-10486_t
MFVKLEGLSDDTTFLSKAASCLYKSMCDVNINIKIKACWSLANLCDHLVSIRRDSEVFNDIPTLILSKVVEVMLLASYDNPKVRSNAVRALGNFARFAPKELLYNSTPVDIQDILNNMKSSETNDASTSASTTINQYYVKNHDKYLIDRIVDSLVTNAAEPSTSFNFVKVKWNACYALGNVFHNADITFEPAPVWLHNIYDTLITLLRTCKNYKIKINASASLATAEHSRVQYSADYELILDTVADSLANVASLIDHSEFQYKDILERQLGVSLIHLLSEMDHATDIDQFKLKPWALDTDTILQAFEKLTPSPPSSSSPSSKKSERPTITEYNRALITLQLLCPPTPRLSTLIDDPISQQTFQ